MGNRWRGIWEMAAALIFYDSMTMIAALVLKNALPLEIQLCSAAGAGVVLSFCYAKKECTASVKIKKWEQPVKEWQREIFWRIALIFFGIGLSLFLNSLLEVSGLKEQFSGYQKTLQEITAPPVWLQAGAAGLVIPWTEELIFRGYGFFSLRSEHSFAVCAIISATIFGLYHGNVVQGVYAAVFGLFLAWVMEIRKKLTDVWSVHAAANLTSVLGGSVIKLNGWTVCASGILLGLLGIGMKMMIRRNRK